MMSGYNSLIKKFPKVKRARDYHIYSFTGKRYLDLWLDGGRAILGHKYGRTILMIKNSLEKGLSSAYPGVWENRLLKQLKLLYPEISAYSLVFAGNNIDYPLIRPFEKKQPIEDCVFDLLLPVPGSNLLRVLCAGKSSAEKLPPSSPIPQYIYSALCRGTADLAAFSKDVDYGRWEIFDAPFWKRQGPWLYPNINETEYEKLFIRLLEEGIILSPDYKLPSCAPYRFTEGEILPIKRLSKEFSQYGF